MIQLPLRVPPLNIAVLGAKLWTHELREDSSDLNTNSVREAVMERNEELNQLSRRWEIQTRDDTRLSLDEGQEEWTWEDRICLQMQ